jgi:peptidyl-prolyl cis-trans isomerase D
MLEALRRATRGWIAKLLIGLLVISFAVWGVSDIFSGAGQQELILVGEEAVTQEEYQRAVQLEQRQMAAERDQQQLTLRDARAAGLDRRVMTRLVGGAALDAHARELGLAVTDQAVAEDIMRSPAFRDETGNFSQQRFQQILFQNNLNEQGFVSSEREAVLRRQLTETLGAAGPVPQTVLDAVNRFSRETRVLRYIEVPVSAAGEAATPTEADLKQFYDNNQRRFTAPEYRRVGAIVATPESLSKDPISEEDLRAAYESRKSQLGKPEQRRVQQISFQTIEEAREALDRIRKGEDFMAVAKERGLSETDADFGLLPQSALADRQVGEVAFKLEKDQVSEPVEGSISNALVRVTEIVPGETKTFEEARAQLETDLKTERAAERIAQLYGQVEDERAAGATLEETAKKLNLPYTPIEAVDRQGRDASGKQIEIPQRDTVVREIFETEPGLEANAVEVEGPGYVWFDVLGTIPEKQKPFEEVRAEVEKGWRDEEQRARLARFSREIVGRLEKGEAMEEIAKAWGGEVKTTPALTRAGGGGLPAQLSAVSQAFALPPQGYGTAPGLEDTRLVFQVAEVKPPAPSSDEEAAKLREQIAPLFADDLIGQYVAGLQNRYGVNVNRAALERLTGGEQ